MEEFLKQEYLDNTILRYLIAILIFIVGLAVIKIFAKIVVKKFKKWAEHSETTIDNFIIQGIEKSVIPLLYFGIFYLAIQTLTLNPRFITILNIASTVVITYFVIRLIISLIRYSLNSYLANKGGENVEQRQKQLGGMITILSFVIWGFGLVFLLDNMGFDIAAVITGLGIGGIAIALAAQTILGDLFSYFVIFFDRPFEVGDFIIVGDKLGSVEYIGIKTTRLRSLGGEQLIFSNTDLTNSRIHNYKRMQRRRVVFKIGVPYQTDVKHVKEIPSIVKNFIAARNDCTFDRAHFAAYGESSLVFEFVYYVLSADYNVYMDTQQEINLHILTEFQRRGIKLAYPTRKLYLNREDWNENDEKDEIKTEIIKTK